MNLFGQWTSTRAEMPCIPGHKQLNLLKKVELSPINREEMPCMLHRNPTRWTYFRHKCKEMTWQALAFTSFWDTPQHFLKAHFCLESGFSFIPSAPEYLLVSFLGCWTQWQRFESSRFTVVWGIQHRISSHLMLDSGFLLFLNFPP